MTRGLVVDLFAGGGGASTGLEAALGRPVDIATRKRFASLVKWAPGDGCWEWQGYRQRRKDFSLSYGLFSVGKVRVLAHRMALILIGGELADGAVVRHRCDNVACVRPAHLEPGTQAENLADMRQRGRAHFNRFPTGTRHPKAKVTPELVRELRRDYAAGGVGVATLGERVGLHASTVHDIVTGKTWRHVTETA